MFTPETWYSFSVRRRLRIHVLECPHRLSDKLLKSSCDALWRCVARSRILRFPRSESSDYFAFLCRSFPEEDLLTRWPVSRCSVSVEAHYRELFRADKSKMQKNLSTAQFSYKTPYKGAFSPGF